MRLFLILISILTLGATANTKVEGNDKSPYTKKTIKVAVIDTGFDMKSDWKRYDHMMQDGDGQPLVKPKICNFGHKDYTNTGMKDNHGHGTHVAGIIAKYAGNADYCLVIIKYFDPNAQYGNSNIENTYKAFEYATRLGVDIINYSGGGTEFNLKEYRAIKKALDRGIVVVAAAGNEGQEVNHHVLKVNVKYDYQTGKQVVHSFQPVYIHRKTGEITKEDVTGYFPASYDPRVIGVKNLAREKTIKAYKKATKKDIKYLPSSNRGEAFYHEEIGDDVLSLKPNNDITLMSGTSQAAPTRVGKMLQLWGKK